MRKNHSLHGSAYESARSGRRIAATFLMAWAMVMSGYHAASAAPELDKTRYHTWWEVNHYLRTVARDPEFEHIVSLIPIGHTREGRLLNVMRISRKGMMRPSPETKPAVFIMGAHHAREHISKEAVLALIDKLITGYGRDDDEGRAITYLVDAGTFYLLPWVNPDGGMSQLRHNPEQRKTNVALDEPQIGAADCDTCGDGIIDGDSPDIAAGDVGAISDSGFEILFPGNKIIGRHLQYWYEDGDFSTWVEDERSDRIQPSFSPFTFNYEGNDPDGDGLYSPYSGEDFVGGTDPNRNYGDPLWGDCYDDDGCSFLSGSQTYAGPAPFSEPETAAVGAFMRSHPNIVCMESLHSGVNEIYPPWWVYPDDKDKATMDLSYQDAVAQYIAQQTGYEVFYGGQYDVKGDTTGYSYIGSSQDPDLGLDFFGGGLLSFTTEIYGMGSESGSAEAVRDWFPHHYTQFDTTYPQGVFITWSDFPLCTTCGPEAMDGGLPWYYYTQFTEYFIFNSDDACGGLDAPGVFHCDYWGIDDSPSYYADFNIFAYFNPPAANWCYEDWNCDGSALTRTVDLQLKHLMYRLYIAPFIRFDHEQASGDSNTLAISVQNTGFLRSSVMTMARPGEDPLVNRAYEMGMVDVTLAQTFGFSVTGPQTINIGWLGGGHVDDPEPKTKSAIFTVSELGAGDLFLVEAGSEKTGRIYALMQAVAPEDNDALSFKMLWTNSVSRSEQVDSYFTGGTEKAAGKRSAQMRTVSRIQADMDHARQSRLTWKRMEGPFDVVPGRVKGIVLRKYHE